MQSKYIKRLSNMMNQLDKSIIGASLGLILLKEKINKARNE